MFYLLLLNRLANLSVGIVCASVGPKTHGNPNIPVIPIGYTPLRICSGLLLLGIHGSMKEKFYWLARYTGIFVLCRWLTRKHIRVLAYHGIWLGEGHFGNFLYMSPARFQQRMSLLKRWGYPVVALDRVFDDSETLPDCATILTIDDGWSGTYQHMLPALERYSFPATVYITSYYCEQQVPVFDVALQYMLAITTREQLDLRAVGLENATLASLKNVEQREDARALLQRYVSGLESETERQNKMAQIGDLLGVSYAEISEQKLFHLVTMDQIADMHKRGIDIQLHTHRHRISMDGADCIAQELTDNRHALQPLVSRQLTHFCYPSGVYDESVWPQLEAAGIVSATTTETGLVSCKSHKFALPRILDGEQVTELEFEAEMSGFGEVKRIMLSMFRIGSGGK